jgi:Calx-beta domain
VEQETIKRERTRIKRWAAIPVALAASVMGLAVAPTAAHASGVVNLPATLTVAEGASAFVVATSAVQNGYVCRLTFEQFSGTATKGTDFFEYATGPVFLGTSDLAGGLVTIQDTLVEGPETFTIKIGLQTDAFSVAWNATGNCTIGNDTMTVTITDDDAAKEAFTITAPADVTEGNTGTTPMTFTLTSPSPTPVACDLLVTAVNGVAPIGQIYPANWELATANYTALGQVITIPAGGTSATFTVNVKGDVVTEPDGSVLATLGYALLGPSLHTCEVKTPGLFQTATAKILDDDTAEAFTITAPADVTEGDTGTTPMTFTLTSPSPTPVACDLLVTAVNGVAPIGQIWPANWVLANANYTTLGQVITIPAGATTATFTVNVIGDIITEADGSVLATLGYALLGPSLHTCEVKTPGLFQYATAKILDDDKQPVFSLVTPTPVTEGNSGTTPLKVTITGTAAPKAPCGVKVYGWNPTSTAFWLYDWTMADTVIPSDYYRYIVLDSASSTFTFDIIGDTVVEPDETFHIYMDPSLVTTANGIVPACDVAPASTFLGAGVVGKIINDDTNAQVSISQPAPIKEGNSGTTPLTFKISTPVAPTADCTVLVSATNQTALWTFDWNVAGQFGFTKVVTIPAGQTAVDFVVDVIGDTVTEGDETFFVSMVGTGLTPCTVDVSKYTATGTILNDDGPVLFSIAGPAPTIEGNAGTTPMKYVISAPNPVAADCQILVSATNQTALWTYDWNVAGQYLYYKTITIPAGSSSADFTVDVIGDTIRELDETYAVTILGGLPNPCLIDTTKYIATGTIIDDETGPLPAATTVSVNDVSVTEGDAGTKNLTFTVTLSAPAVGNEVVLATTLNVTAAAGSDYTFVNVPVTFAAGETSKTVNVPVIGDTTVELDETLNLVLSLPANVTIAKGTGLGTIVNDDKVRAISVNDQRVVEGNLGQRSMVFTLTLDAPARGNETVAVTATNVTATAGSDFAALVTTVSFAAGETSKQVTVNILGDTVVELDETLNLVLSAPVNATVAKAIGVGTIVNDDSVVVVPPTQRKVSVNDVAVVEGNAGTKVMTFTVSLDAPALGTEKVSVTTSNGTAAAGSDYAALAATVVSFAAGETSKTVSVTINGDTTVEPNETLNVVLSAPLNATIVKGTGIGTITNDDNVVVPPTQRKLSVNDVKVVEGNLGQRSMVFTLTLDGPAAGTESVMVNSANGTATAGSDFVALAATKVTFAAGETSKQVTVNLLGDTLVELDETLNLVLSTPANLTIVKGTGVGTITNDDVAAPAGPRKVSINWSHTAEGNNGTRPLSFVISLDGPAVGNEKITVNTVNGTATAGSDFVAMAPTVVSFAAGETSKTIFVTINGDTLVEANEIFTLPLSNAVNVTINAASGVGQGTIANDD